MEGLTTPVSRTEHARNARTAKKKGKDSSKKSEQSRSAIVDKREQSQRTLGQQFHKMARTLRIVRITFTGEDPLMNDNIWFGLICDMISTDFCNQKAIEYVKRKSGRKFDMVPLALKPFVNDWVIYKRVLNQIPLFECVKLSCFGGYAFYL